MPAWHESRFTGLFSEVSRLPRRAHDPDVDVHTGSVPAWGPRTDPLPVSGCGWDAEAALAACVGEAVERFQPYRLPVDAVVRASYDAWPLEERAVDPTRWVLFHREQHALDAFPFRPFTGRTCCGWVTCRAVRSGEPCWAPEELVFLYPPEGRAHALGPSISTGMSAARTGDRALLGGLQEVVERDALVGAWWGRYPLEEWPASEVWDLLGEDRTARVRRSNLTYRFYRAHSPFSEHVTLVRLEGEDLEGWCFSIGSACRATREAAWDKALLEAVQGRHYVRYLRSIRRDESPCEAPADFSAHALYYSLRPERLADTVLERAVEPDGRPGAEDCEDLDVLLARLGPEHEVLFRLITPPIAAQARDDWIVLRVLVPGLQPLHADHSLPYLGGPLWAPRDLAAWCAAPPHPFP